MLGIGAGYGIYVKERNRVILQYMRRLEGFKHRKPEFSGVSRPELRDQTLKAASEGAIVVYAPSKTGKSCFLQEIAAVCENSIYILAKSSIANSINTLELPFEFSDTQTNESLQILAKLIENSPKALIILDGIEALSENDRKHIIVLLKSLINQGKCKAIISTNNIEICNSTLNYLKSEVFELPPLTKTETHAALKDLPGYSYENIENLFNMCDGGLDFALDMISNGKSWREYLDDKEKLIIAHLKELSIHNETKLKILHSIMSVHDARPLGDLYCKTALANEFISRGIMQARLNDSAQFRNKFIIKVIKDFIIS